MFDPFLNTRISANHDKEEGHSANGEILIKVLKLFCRISIFHNLTQRKMKMKNVEGKSLLIFPLCMSSKTWMKSHAFNSIIPLFQGYMNSY